MPQRMQRLLQGLPASSAVHLHSTLHTAEWSLQTNLTRSVHHLEPYNSFLTCLEYILIPYFGLQPSGSILLSPSPTMTCSVLPHVPSKLQSHRLLSVSCMSPSASCHRAFAQAVLSAWNVFLTHLYKAGSLLPFRSWSNVTFSQRPSLTIHFLLSHHHHCGFSFLFFNRLYFLEHF